MTDTATRVVDAYVSYLRRSIRGYAYGEGTLLDLPMSFADGEGVSVVVTEVGAELYNVSDRGLAASVLGMAGVDLSRGARLRESWEAVRATTARPKPYGRDADPFEIAAFSGADDLAETIDRVAAAMLRADGLRALAKPEPIATIRDRIIKRAHDAALEVVPSAPVTTKFGGSRTVTAQVKGARTMYLQAVGPSGYDHARALFTDVEVSKSRLAAVIARDADVDRSRRASLAADGFVVDELDLPAFLLDLAA